MKNDRGREGVGDKKKKTKDRKSMGDEIHQNSWSKVKRI